MFIRIGVLAVMGGSLSEGVDFKDDLCRLLVLVGVPFPPPAVKKLEILRIEMSAEKDPIKYSTMKAIRNVNQTLGRAVRHAKDWCMIVLADERYEGLKPLLSREISPLAKISPNTEEMLSDFQKFREGKL
eukprot:GHVH01003165.1.p1 GENE.GHVH01003165.1~~GHVH01003165.1.p1  ORF type:complete len:130 (-),score=11.54 GHVH01003165.1:21-410(-)